MATEYGWMGKILRVDLSTGSISTMETAAYVPQYVGGLGIAARIAWEELAPGVGALDPGNMLFTMVGPLSGTVASGGGRGVVAGIAPQQWPSVFSRSGFGGHWGAEVKYAGYDGIVCVGRAERPVYLWVNDERAELRDAADLWGTGTYATTTALRARHGAQTRVLACGQAGENLCRIACVQTETGNAAGQGGYGAVMGSKNLKAIAVCGTQGVRVAQPERLLDLALNASREGLGPRRPGDGPARSRPQQREMMSRLKKCGFCLSQCAGQHVMNVPGEVTHGIHSTHLFCFGYMTSPRGNVEARTMTSDYGLNGWEIAYGIIPWLMLCKQHGLVDTVDGFPIPVPEKEIHYLHETPRLSPEFTMHMLRTIALREGEMGDALADGACYAAERLFGGAGAPLLDRIYPRRFGQTNHWNAHWGTGGRPYFPFWLVPVLQFCVDTRDPASDSTHAYTTHLLSYLPQHGPHQGPVTPEQARAICERVYGEPDVYNPIYTYDKPETKAIPAILHHNWGMLLESLTLCDYEQPRIFSMETEDRAADTEMMAKLFSACTGQETDFATLTEAGSRIFNVLRAIDVRNHDRSRAVDWAAAKTMTEPALSDGVVLDLERFGPMLDRYYELRGWNPANGYPTRAGLEALGLGDVADGLERAGRLG